MSADKVAIYLTKTEVGVLRRLIVEESQRLGLNNFQRKSEWPSKGKRMLSVANKIWEARQYFNGSGEEGV